MRFLASLLALTLFAGCAGYKIGPIKPTPMKKVSKICVKNFKNDTLEPRISALLANALIKQLQVDGTYEVTDEGRADAIIEGTLTEIERRPSRSLSGNTLQTREYLLYLRGRYKVTNARDGVILDQRNVTAYTSFFVSSPNLLTADSNQDERQALPLAAEEFASRISSIVCEGW
jgi:hypothetical protein